MRESRIAYDTPTAEPPRQLSHQEKAILLIQNPLHVRRLINDNSLFEFTKYFWGEVSNDTFVPNWHIQLFCRELEVIAERVSRNEPKLYDLIINVPPGMTKTIIVSIMYPVWCWTKWYWMRFITGSYSKDLSLESAEYSRDLIRSEKFRGLYPELDLKEDKDNKSNFKVIKRVSIYPGHVPRIFYGGNRFSTSVGGTVTGFHGHINIVDDPLNPKQAASEKELKTANHWVDQTISSRKTNKKVSTMILIMQRLHQDDPTGHILAKKKKRIRHICLPGEIREYGKFVNPPELAANYVDGLLDPHRLDWEDLEEMKADLGQYGYAGQVGQNPTPPGGGMFQIDKLHIIDRLPSDVNFIETVRYWDKAGSEGTGCFTAGVKMSHLTGNRFIIHDVKKGQWSTHERERMIRQTAEADGQSVTIYIEQEPGSGGKESAEATITNLAGFSCYADKPTGDKAYRADPFSVQVNNGNISMLYGDWNKAFTDELEYFPFGTYKDQVDAASGAFNHLVGTREAQVIGGGRRR